MSALLTFSQAVLGTTNNDFNLVIDVVLDEFIDAKCAWHAIDQRQHICAEGILKLGVLVQVIKNNLWDGIVTKNDD